MPIRSFLFRLSPDYTSCFELLTEDSPKSSHGHFRLVHLIWVCSFSGYLLLLLFRPIYLFYVCFYCHAVISINKCNDPIKQVTILSTVLRCEWKSWISDSVQQLVVVQMRCADVKQLWESERERTRSSWITQVFSDYWFNLIVCVDLFTHLTYMLYSINVCRNFPLYKLESYGND